MIRTASAQWNGSGKEGTGHLTTQSTVLNKTQYAFSSRFEDGIGTNPEELVAAAHAGCFAMKLAFVLGGAGHTPNSINITCSITLDRAVDTITKSHLVVEADVPGITLEAFLEAVTLVEKTCLISKLFTAEITTTASLVQYNTNDSVD